MTTDPFGNCRRCGRYTTPTTGCDCGPPTWQEHASHALDVALGTHPYPSIRRLVVAGQPVPSDWVRQLLEDYDRLRDK